MVAPDPGVKPDVWLVEFAENFDAGGLRRLLETWGRGWGLGRVLRADAGIRGWTLSEGKQGP